MRITCPGCGAQYEVADEAIPPGGRDVQCSACGNVWFVTGEAVSEPDSDPDPDIDASGDSVLPEEAGEEEAPETVPGEQPEPGPEPGPEPAPSSAVAPRRPALSPEVTAILREEAERERARREAERAAQEVAVQPDLGLDEAMEPVRRRADEARTVMAGLRAEPAPAPAEPEPAAPPPDADPAPDDPVPEAPRGRERLPDIEEINASLRAATERAPAYVAESPVPRARSAGFRTGFLGMIVLAGLALAVYLGAPRIAESVPAATPHLERYVAGVDDLRLWLDRQVQGLIPAEDGAE